MRSVNPAPGHEIHPSGQEATQPAAKPLDLSHQAPQAPIKLDSDLTANPQVQASQALNQEMLSILKSLSTMLPSNEGLGGHAPIGAFSAMAPRIRKAIQQASEMQGPAPRPELDLKRQQFVDLIARMTSPSEGDMNAGDNEMVLGELIATARDLRREALDPRPNRPVDLDSAMLGVIRGTLQWAKGQGGDAPRMAAEDLLALIEEHRPETPFGAVNDYPGMFWK